MSWSVISTWKMSLEGNRKAGRILESHGTAGDAVLLGVQDVEDNPAFHSVGYSGLPDAGGYVTLDAGYMDGDTLEFGAVGCLEGYRSPAAIARSLIHYPYNNFLVGEGAAAYAGNHGFERRDNLTKDSAERYLRERNLNQTHSSYKGHDTVCFLARDEKGTIVSCTSTSGLYLKEHGRVGDTPLPGCGYYADSTIGAAAATGVGEEIMKGALSRAVVDLMAQGMHVQEAADKALADLKERLGENIRPISLIAMDKDGNTGVSTTLAFPFCVAKEGGDTELYLAEPSETGITSIRKIEDPSELSMD